MKKEEADKRGRGAPEKEVDLSFLGILIFGLIGATVAAFALNRSKSLWNNGRSFRTSFQEEARERYYRRLREEYEAEMERVERIQQMQSIFNRERSKIKRNYDSSQQNGPVAYDQRYQMNDWYWTEDTSFRDHNRNFREADLASSGVPLSHHYFVLGLDRLRTKPYTDNEIKSAFRAKAKTFHPDQNQDNKEFAEAKFKEVMVSYEAIKNERRTICDNKRT